jgi:hypothetical protein
MREGFIEYMSESNLQNKLEEIQSIISPEQFIKKHFGDENPDFMFEKVIT